MSGCLKKDASTGSASASSNAVASQQTQGVAVPEEDKPVVEIKVLKPGQEVGLSVTKFPPGVEKLSYELVYLSQGRERGVVGSYKQGDQIKRLKFGSCSSGVCVYDKDVTDARLIIKFNYQGQPVSLEYPVAVN